MLRQILHQNNDVFVNIIYYVCICIWLRARAYICISVLLIIELASITSFFICELLLYYYSLFYLYLYIFSFSSNIVVLNTLLRYYGELMQYYYYTLCSNAIQIL